MKAGFKLLVPSALFLALSCLNPAAAHETGVGTAAAHEIGVGTGIICDTAEQTARYVALLEHDADQALKTVNSENSSSSCTMARIAFIRGKEVARARAKNSPVSIVEIFVVGIVTPLGIDRIPPLPQFTLFPVEEHAV
jgi:hypothetical protein